MDTPRSKTLTVVALAIAAAALTLLFCCSLDLTSAAEYLITLPVLGMAVAANQPIKHDMGNRSSLPVLASKRLHEGTIAFVDASTGYATDDDDSGANAFAGIVKIEADNSSGSNGDINVELLTDGVVELVGSGFTQADVGKAIYATDNYTITTSAASATRIGTCRRFVSATRLAVAITPDVDVDTDT